MSQRGGSAVDPRWIMVPGTVHGPIRTTEPMQMIRVWIRVRM